MFCLDSAQLIALFDFNETNFQEKHIYSTDDLIHLKIGLFKESDKWTARGKKE